jgi:DNA-binding transcriptional regulator YiaG
MNGCYPPGVTQWHIDNGHERRLKAMTEAALFRRCRKALGLSLNEMARALLIASDRNPRRWEDGTRPISGPAWVALEYMLRETGELDLADQVAEVVQQRRIASVECSGDGADRH